MAKKHNKNPNESPNESPYIAVRWPAALRQDLKIAAASADPPMTMTECLQQCFEEKYGKKKRHKGK